MGAVTLWWIYYQLPATDTGPHRFHHSQQERWAHLLRSSVGGQFVRDGWGWWAGDLEHRGWIMTNGSFNKIKDGLQTLTKVTGSPCQFSSLDRFTLRQFLLLHLSLFSTDKGFVSDPLSMLVFSTTTQRLPTFWLESAVRCLSCICSTWGKY